MLILLLSWNAHLEGEGCENQLQQHIECCWASMPWDSAVYSQSLEQSQSTVWLLQVTVQQAAKQKRPDASSLSSSSWWSPFTHPGSCCRETGIFHARHCFSAASKLPRKSSSMDIGKVSAALLNERIELALLKLCCCESALLRVSC